MAGVRIARASSELAVLPGVLAAALLGFPGCSGGGGGGGGSTAGTVAGTATDTQGRPLPGATITVCSSVFYSSCITATTGTDGSYAVRLTPDNQWQATGAVTTTYNGKTYCLPLAIDNTNTFSSTEAAVRNFSWKLSGAIPGMTPTNYASSYFGVTLNVVYSSNVNSNTAFVEVDLAPAGPLVDGSPGKSLSDIVGRWASDAVGNIPLGRYTISARYVPTGGSPASIGIATSAFDPPAASVTVDFPPDPGGSCVLEPEATVYVTGP